MKVAVLINGNYHPYLRRVDLHRNIEKFQEIFSECDIYYQTWDDLEDRHIFKGVDVDLKFVSKPDTVDYDPFVHASENLPTDIFKGISRFTKTSDRAVALRTFSCLQHISLSKQYNSIPKGYDFYIRLRWDAYIADNFPLKDILKLAEDNVIGIAAHNNHPSIRKKFIVKSNNEYTRVQSMRRGLKEHIDKGLYCLIDADNDYEKNHWNSFLSDFLIVFKEEDMEGFDIEESYRNKELYGAEYGWHQILCRKRKHINIDGLVGIHRLVDSSYITYLKLKKSKTL